MTQLPKFTVTLLHPRYWLTWLGIGFLWLLVQLPYPVISVWAKAWVVLRKCL
ncbi:lipid A biosynthesis lauroyl (or palmitoleoyl) acyltransferase [Enterobacter cloacae]|uniref:Lipid A biosynthesis lauroyl (Or palmitoleoyl) acyltransferase n=1 Tax=Enterobacter cloacae TaxID=550 RepID=A0A377M475_ENTCL|nr:lipid A biosynthesis lauroyl (or palmitoleoyl) acyltransferase [Enterobacter cloacae]